MVSAAQKRAQDRAKGITTYNKATGTTQPSTTGGGSTPSTTSTPSTQTNNSNFWAGAADYAGGTPTQTNTNPAIFSPNQATGNYQAPTNYQTNPNIPGQAQTDFSQTNTNKINPNQFKYGQAAITGGVNQQDRNLQLGSYYAGIGAKSYQDIYNDLSKIQSYASMDEAAKQRTAQDIYQKMGQYVTPEMTPEEKMMANLKKELGRAQTRGETEISDFMRTVFANQQTIDKGIEKFSNWNDINRKVQGVAEAVARNKMLNAGKGEVTTAQLTESDIQAAMQATGATREEVMAIANGRGYEGLQRSDKYKSEYLTKDYDRWVEDTTLQKERNLQDLKTNLDQTRQNIGRQIQDIVEQVKMNVDAAEKIGALKGFNRSSGYLDGIVSVQAEGNKLVDRLQTQLMNAENADEESRSRLLEDFNRNLSRAKFDMDQQLNDLKNTTAVELGQLQAKYSIGSPEMALALNDLQERAINFSNTAYSNYSQAMSANIAAKQEELDYITNQENKRLNQINTLQTVMSANNGAAVMNMSMNTLKEYAKQGMKTDQVSAFRSAMINKTIASFSGLTSDDKENVTRLIDQGMTPAQVVQQLQSQGKQYIGSAGTGDWKIQSINGTDMWVNPKTMEIRSIEQGMPTNTQGGASYTPVSEQQINSGIGKLLSSNELTNKKAQCGEGVNDWLISIGAISENMFLDPIDSKKANINSNTGKIGSVVVFDPTGSARGEKQKEKYGFVAGHVAIVTAVDANGNPTRIGHWNKNGDKQYIEEALPSGRNKYIKGYFDPTKQPTQTSSQGGDITIDQVINFNDDVTRRKMSKEEVKKIGEAKKAVMSDPNATIEDMLAWSNGGKSIGETQSKSLIKFEQALDQLDAVQTQISKMKTGPILGALRSLNPYDTDAQVLKAKLQGLVPTMARGVYGEVGVLTDNDIRLYAKTLPTLKGTDAINKGVLAYTLDILAGGYKRTLASLAGQGYDVSGLEGMYMNMKGQADMLRQEIGMSTTPDTQGGNNDPLGIR